MNDFDSRLVLVNRFDPETRCLVSIPPLRDDVPRTLAQRIDFYRRLRKESEFLSLKDLWLESLSPLSVPTPEVAQYRTAKDSMTIVMCPTPGQLPMLYDITSVQDMGVFICHQFVTGSWETVRYAFEELGAKVVVADSIWDPSPVEATPLFPVEEIFARDPGFVFGKTFYAPSTEAHADFISSLIIQISNSFDFAENVLLQRAAEISAEHKRDHAEKVVKAFRENGIDLAYRKINAFFEGGDVFVDAKKGCIFIGRDPRRLFEIRERNHEKLHDILVKATGAEVIAIDRFEQLPEGAKAQSGNRSHIDTIMSVLPGGELLFDPRYTSSDSAALLKRIYGKEIIYVGDDNPEQIDGIMGKQVQNYVPNLVAVGRTLVMPNCSETLRKNLMQKDYTVVSARELGLNPNNLYIRGGSIHCITNTLP